MWKAKQKHSTAHICFLLRVQRCFFGTSQKRHGNGRTVVWGKALIAGIPFTLDSRSQLNRTRYIIYMLLLVVLSCTNLKWMGTSQTALWRLTMDYHGLGGLEQKGVINRNYIAATEYLYKTKATQPLGSTQVLLVRLLWVLLECNIRSSHDA